MRLFYNSDTRNAQGLYRINFKHLIGKGKFDSYRAAYMRDYAELSGKKQRRAVDCSTKSYYNEFKSTKSYF